MIELHKDHKLVQAYAVMYTLVMGLDENGNRPSDEDTARALVYFASDEYDGDFLPWPRPPIDPKLAAYDAATDALESFQAGLMTEQELAHALKSAGEIIGGHSDAA